MVGISDVVATNQKSNSANPPVNNTVDINTKTLPEIVNTNSDPQPLINPRFNEDSNDD